MACFRLVIKCLKFHLWVRGRLSRLSYFLMPPFARIVLALKPPLAVSAFYNESVGPSMI